jgi:hypothetical protein
MVFHIIRNITTVNYGIPNIAQHYNGKLVFQILRNIKMVNYGNPNIMEHYNVVYRCNVPQYLDYHSLPF